MHTHIALYAWKDSVTEEQILDVLARIEALAGQIPGIIDIQTGKNMSEYSEGYTHVIVVRGKTRAAIDAYRAHPDHIKIAQIIETMEERGIGVDFSTG